MTEEHRYEMNSKWVRDKIVTMEIEGKPAINIATPLDFWPDAPPEMISPEDLFLGSAVACFGVSMHGVAKRFHVEFEDFRVNGVGTLAKGEFGWEFDQITLNVVVLAKQESDIKKLEKVAERAHQYCLVANSMKCPVHLNYEVKMSSPKTLTK